MMLTICSTPWIMFNTLCSCMCNICSTEGTFDWILLIIEHKGRVKKLNDVIINNARLKSRSVKEKRRCSSKASQERI